MVFVLCIAWALSVASPATSGDPGLNPPSGVAVERDGAQATLVDLVAELERNNPDLQAGRLEIDMRTARVAPAGALPDPVLTASSMSGLTRPPFFPAATTTNAFRLVGISQEFPYPGKRGLRTAVVSTDADIQRWTYEERRRALVADLKTTYLEYVLTSRSLQIVAENKTLADHLRQIAEARFSVGKALQQDVVKAQLEISMLIERQTVLEQQRAALVARINGLLFRPAGSAPPPVVAYASAPVPHDIEALQADVQSHSAALQRDAKAIDKSQRALSLARKELRPDFRIGVAAQRYAGDMPWMYGVDFMVSLPIYSSRKQRPLIDEAAAALSASERTRENTSAMAAAEVTQDALAAASADRLAALYADSVLPQAQLALDSALASYQVGTLDFLSVITNFQVVLAAELSREEQQVRRDQALVRLEPLVGTVFVQ